MFEILTTEQEASTQRSAAWLESSADGLLTLEAERFLLSLPFDCVPGNVALRKPNWVNQMAQLWFHDGDLVAYVEQLLNAHAADTEIAFQHHTTLKDELTILKSWAQAERSHSDTFQ